jgi:hypothetical protein
MHLGAMISKQKSTIYALPTFPENIGPNQY